MGTLKINQKVLPGIGAIYEAFVVSLPFLSAIQFLTILTMFYENLKVYIHPVMPWVTFPIFISTVASVMCCIMVVVYKFLLPSIWNFRGKQLYGFESELMKEVKELRKEIKELKENG